MSNRPWSRAAVAEAYRLYRARWRALARDQRPRALNQAEFISAFEEYAELAALLHPLADDERPSAEHSRAELLRLLLLLSF